MAQYDGSIRINTEINSKNAQAQLMTLENRIVKTTDKIASLRQKMDSLKDVQIPTQEYIEVQKQIEATEKKINDLMARQERFLETGGKESSSAYQRMQYDLEELQNSLPYLQSELQDLVDTGKAFTLGSDTEEYSKLGQELQYAENNLAALNKRHDELIAKQGTVAQRFSKMKNSAKKAFDAINTGAKQSNASLSGGLKTILKYGFGIRSLYVLFNKIRNGIKEGFTNLMGYSDGFANSIQSVKNSMKTLSNQIAGAFRPIVEMVIPWLNSLINALTAAMNKLAQFIAVLTGASTFTRAKKIQDAYNKSLGGTAKAADKARGALAKFDDLDVLEKQDYEEARETLSKDMFEEVPVDTEVIGWLDDILARLNELKNIFSQGFWDGLGDWESRWESIKKSATFIKDSLISIWTDSAVLSAQDGYYKSLLYMFGSVAGSISSIGLTIGTNLIGGLEKYLEENKGRIKEFLVSMFDIGAEISQLIAEFSQSFAFVFEAFGSDDAQQLTANLIGIFTDAVMGTLEVVEKLARDILEIFVKPFTENKEGFRTALEGFLGVLSEVAGTIKQGVDNTFAKISEVYDEHFKPFFDSVANGLSQLVSSFLEFWNNNMQPILDEWAVLFDELWQEHLQPVIDNLIELFGTVADSLKALWEETLMPVIDWIIQYVMPILAKVVDFFVKDFFRILGVVSDVVSGIIKVIGGIITFLTGQFTGEWSKSWDGIKQIFEGIWDAIKSIFKDQINAIIDFTEFLVNGTIKGINAIINMLEELATIKNPLNGNVIWSLDLPEIPPVSIPRLATGAVIRGGNPFMAVLGDQPAGRTNIEAPADLIREMARQGIREELAGMNFANASSGQTKVVLNVNGADVGEAIIDDLFSVMQRRGYDVDVLGVT